jgi:hypothetical protein
MMHKVKKNSSPMRKVHVTAVRTNTTICIKNIFSTLKGFIKYGNNEPNETYVGAFMGTSTGGAIILYIQYR